jgi:hypothetical protein
MNLSQPPSWVASGCYIFLAVAIVLAISAVYNVFILYSLPASVVKGIPLLPTAITLLLSAGLSILLAMMQHWMCTAVFPVKTEAFAVPCKNDAECVAVMGSPQRDYAACGARGTCGSYTMQNNMEPSMLPAYDAPMGGVGLGLMTAPTPATVEAFKSGKVGTNRKMNGKKY